jgi:ubiquitin-conjugating enzyme E2 H
MSSPVQGKRRMDTDVIKLIESKHEVILGAVFFVHSDLQQTLFQVTILGGLNEFCVKFFGPPGTPYEGGVWKM